MVRVYSFVNNVHFISREKAAHIIDSLSKMSSNWQLSRANSIMDRKKADGKQDADHLTITYDDIKTDLDNCTDAPPGASLKHAIDEHQKNEFVLTLDEGVEQYNQINSAHIAVQTQAIEAPPEVWERIASHLEGADIAHLSLASPFHKFSCEFTYIKNLLKKEGILVDAHLRGFLRDKQWGINDVRQRITEIKNLLYEKENDIFRSEVKTNINAIRSSGWLLARFFDGTLQVNGYFSAMGMRTILRKEAQNLIDRLDGYQHLAQIAGPTWSGDLLQDSWMVQHLIRGDISMKQFIVT